MAHLKKIRAFCFVLGFLPSKESCWMSSMTPRPYTRSITMLLNLGDFMWKNDQPYFDFMLFKSFSHVMRWWGDQEEERREVGAASSAQLLTLCKSCTERQPPRCTWVWNMKWTGIGVVEHKFWRGERTTVLSHTPASPPYVCCHP